MRQRIERSGKVDTTAHSSHSVSKSTVEGMDAVQSAQLDICSQRNYHNDEELDVGMKPKSDGQDRIDSNSKHDDGSGSQSNPRSRKEERLGSHSQGTQSIEAYLDVNDHGACCAGCCSFVK